MKHIYPFILVFSTFYSAQGQTMLDSVLISSSRTELEVQKTGRAVTVLTSKEIEALPVNTIEEMLAYVSGVNINSRGGFGVQADIGIRGATYAQVLVLIDNQRINDPLTGHFNSYIPLPICEIARVEIIKGTCATAFGADAVGGIIHIKSKTFVSNEPKTSFSGSLGLGQFNLLNADAGVHHHSGRWGYSFGLKTMNSTGQTFENPNFKVIPAADSTYKQFFNVQSATTSLKYKSDKFMFYARTSYDWRSFSAKYFYTTGAFDEAVEEVATLWSQVMMQYSSSFGKTSFTIGHRNTNDSFLYNPLFGANIHTTNRVNATLNQLFSINNSSSINIGSQVDLQNIISTDRGNHQAFNYGFFAIYNGSTNGFNYTAGLRSEFIASNKLAFIPQLSISKVLSNGYLHTSLGSAVRQADFTERYVSFNLNPLGAGRNAGNPDLLNEEAIAADFGYYTQPIKQISFHPVIFYRNSKNLIDYSLTNSNEIKNLTNLTPNTTYLYAINIGSTQTMGVELEMGYKHEIADLAYINHRFAYTYLQTKNDANVVSKYLANHPLQQLSYGIDIKLRSWNINAGLFVFQRNAEEFKPDVKGIPAGYTLLNARISYRVNKLPIQLFAEGRNLLDTKYQEILGAEMPRQWIYSGLKWNLGL